MADPQTPDPVADILRKAPASDAVRADVWDAFHQSASADDFASAVKAMAVPDSVKADLWDLKHTQAPSSASPMNFAVVNGQRVPVEEPNTAGTFVKHAAQQVNPVPLGQLLPFPRALGGAGWDAPLKAGEHILKAQGAQFDLAKAAYDKGDYATAASHALGWLLPVIGPTLAGAGDELKQGQVAAGLGDAAGLSAALFGPQAVQLGKESAAAGRLADTAEKGATARAVETMAPQVGPNKVRLGNQAAKVGTDVLQNTSATSRSGMLDQASSKLGDAYGALDAAYDKVPDTRMYPTAPIKLAIQREIQNLSVNGIGGAVEPATRSARIGSLRQALSEVNQLGSMANLDNLRKLRIAWDEGAQGMFTPAVAQDFLKARGTGAGWADARSSLNDFIVSQHPELAPLNADAHLWKTAVDVMQAAEEADRVRPKVGRSIMARGLGAAVGGSTEGPWGAAVGAVVGPTFERAIANLSPSLKILAGRQMANLADAIRAGNITRAQSLVGSLKTMVRGVAVKAAQVGQNVAPVSGASTPLVPQVSQ